MDEDTQGAAHSWTPVPDPTERTKEDLLRELSHVRDLSDEKFRGVDARFNGVDEKFLDVAHRTAEQKTDTKDALDAALAAQKEAVAKSETATTKQIDALAVLIDKSDERRGDEINELKSSIVRLEAARQNQAEGKTDNRGSMMLAVMIGSLTVGVLGFLMGVAVILTNK